MLKYASENFKLEAEGGGKKEFFRINCKVCVGKNKSPPKFTIRLHVLKILEV